jgi:serine/threonine protein kinase
LKAHYHYPEKNISRESRDLINHILVPDPDLRYGIKQIKQHKWFINAYQPSVPISPGLRIGLDKP